MLLFLLLCDRQYHLQANKNNDIISNAVFVRIPHTDLHQQQVQSALFPANSGEICQTLHRLYTQTLKM